MNKKLLMFCFMLPMLVFGQENADSKHVLASEPFLEVDAKEKFYFEHEDQIIVIKLNKEFIVLQKFDPVSNKVIDRKSFPILKKGALLEKLLFFGDEHYLIYSYWDKKNKVEYLYSRKINKENIRLGEEKQVLSSELKLDGELINYGYYKFGVEDKYQFRFSEDKQNLLIASKLKPKREYDRKYHAEIKLCVFNTDFEMVSNRTIEMQTTYMLSSYYDYTITNSGIVYILSDVYEEYYFDYYLGENKNYHIELLKIDEGEIETILIGEADYYVKKMQVKPGKNNEVYIAGYYTEKGVLSDVDGIFYCKILDNRVSSIKYFPFTLEFINSYEDEKTRKKNARLLKKDKLDYQNLKLKELIVNEDGLIIIGEQYEVIEIQGAGGYFVNSSINRGVSHYSGTKTTYTYGDMIICDIKNDKLNWLYKIPKSQSVPDKKDYFVYTKKTDGVGNNSYRIIKDENYYNILYWDKSSNVHIDESRGAYLLENGDWGNLMNTQINIKNGEFKRKTIFKPIEYFKSENTLIRDWHFSGELKYLVPFQNNTKLFLELYNYGVRKPKQNIVFQIAL